MPTTTKKPVARSKPTTKAKKPVTHKKAAARHTKVSEVRSFRVAPESKPFLSVSPNIQSFYWAVIGILVLLLAAWVMYLTVKIETIYDNVSQTEIVHTISPKK